MVNEQRIMDMKRKQEGTLYTDRVAQSPDGKYRWACEVCLLTNISFLLHTLKVFTFVGIGLAVFMSVIRLFMGHPLGDIVVAAGILMLGAWGLAGVSYIIYVFIRGFRFTVCYTMDEKQVREQFTPARLTKIPDDKGLKGLINVLSSRPGLPGWGFVYATGESTSTMPLARVKNVKPRRWLRHVKVSLGIDSLRVFVPEEDFDFVYQFLVQNSKAHPQETK